MTKKRYSWDYYRPGMEYAGLKIIEVKTQAVNQRETIYKIRYNCCGAETELTHERILHRERTDVGACGNCSQGGWKYFQDGEIISGYKILSRTSNGRQTQKKTMYQAKALCCGNEFEVSHYLLIRRMNDLATDCRRCSAKNRDDNAKELRHEIRQRRQEERRRKKEGEFSTAGIPYGVGIYPDWPVPSHVPIGAHVLWEDGMRT